MLQGCTPRWDLEGGPFPPGENVAPTEVGVISPSAYGR